MSKGIRDVALVFSIVLGIGVIYGGIMGDWGFVLDGRYLYPFLGFAAILAVYQLVIVPQKWMKATEKRMQAQAGVSIFRFGEEHILVTGDLGESVLPYGDLRSIVEMPERNILADGREVYVLARQHFVKGDPAAFGAFIEKKTGLKVKQNRL